MSRVCVCIEGQLRGSIRCGPTICKYLVESLNADLVLYIQKHDNVDIDSVGLQQYGIPKKVVLYDNPDNFDNVFDSLCNTYGYDNTMWRNTFNTVPDDNYKLGYKKTGTCIRRMYNRYLIYEEIIKNSDYEWLILLRSDLFFVDYFDMDELNDSCINITNVCCWKSGYNNNFIAIPKSLFRPTLTYILQFLNGNFMEHYMKQPIKSRVKINEELFFKINMDLQNISRNLITHRWYISADKIDDYTSWSKIDKDGENLYKYIDEYKVVIKYMNTLNNNNNYNNTFYSQIGQDEYYVKNIINYKKNGTFIEIGAHDGITFSNTYYLEKNLGWNGVCVEPNPESYIKCNSIRKCKTYNKAIYSESGKKVNLVIPCGNGFVHGGLSQLCGIEGEISDNNLYRAFPSQYSAKKTVQVDTININDLLRDNSMFVVDYMSIDTEGYELNILRSIDYTVFKIKFITVEHGCDLSYQKQIFDFMHTVGYDRHRTNKWDDEYILIETVNSFDIFDTLLSRKVKIPTDIFRLVEMKGIPNFHNERIRAEQQSNSGTFDDIYKIYASMKGIDQNEMDRIKRLEIETELESIIPISTNINRMSETDIIISDMYLDEQTLRKFLRKVGVLTNNTIYVSSGGKHNGSMWENLIKHYKFGLHIGDNIHSDINMSKKYGITSKLTVAYKHTKLENDLQLELCNLIREYRLLNPYFEYSPEYELYAEQCKCNIMILSAFSVQIKRILEREDLDHVMFSTRDCCLLQKIFGMMYPNVRTTEYNTSRKMYQNYNAEYVEYIKQIYTNKSIIIDLNGAFKTGRNLYMNAIGKLPRVHIMCYNQTCPLYDGLTFACMHKMSDYIEVLNSDLVGTLIGYNGEKFIREDNEYNIDRIKIIHKSVDGFVEFITRRDIGAFITYCGTALDQLDGKLFSNGYFSNTYNALLKL